MTEDDFFGEWAAVRALLVTPNQGGDVATSTAARRLSDMASNSRQQALAAAVQVRAGAQFGDTALSNSAFNRIASLTADELLEALATIGDLTALGHWSDRWRAIWPALDAVGDLSIDLVRFPSADLAVRLCEGRWSPPEDLMPELQRELRLQVGWAAIECVLDSGDPACGGLVEARWLDFRANEPGWWERALQRSVLTLVNGSVAEAVRRIQLLYQANPPRWADRSVQMEMTRFCSLSGSTLAQWLGMCPGGLPDRQHAASTTHAAFAALAALLSTPERGRPAKVQALGPDLWQSAPWAAFGAFCVPGHRDAVRELLGREIARMNDEQWAAFPWSGRHETFASSCSQLEDAELALQLLERSLRINDHPELRIRLAAVLARSVVSSLASNASDLARRLGDDLELLPPPTRSLLSRGGTYRAVVDGSNVMWGGAGRDAGAVPSLKLLLAVREELVTAGFTEIGIFLDARTKYDVSSAERREVERMVARREITVVQGVADPAILRYFLEHPEFSVIVTLDEYRDWRATNDFLGLREWWPQCRRRFYVAPDGRPRFNPPLERPAS